MTTKVHGKEQVREYSLTNVDIAVNAAIETSKLADGALVPLLNQSNIFTQKQSFPAGVTGLPAPTVDSDAATRKWVLDAVAGVRDPKDAVSCATDCDLGCSYANGVLTEIVNGVCVIDTVALAVSDRVLVKNQTDTTQNGIYTVSAIGGPAAPFVLTRAGDFNSPDNIADGAFVFVNNGDKNKGSGWLVKLSETPVQLGSTQITFSQMSSAVSSIVAGDGLVQNGNNLAVVGGNGVLVLPDSVELNVDLSCFQFNSGVLSVKVGKYAEVGHTHVGSDIISAVAEATHSDVADTAADSNSLGGKLASAYSLVGHVHAGSDITSAVAEATHSVSADLASVAINASNADKLQNHVASDFAVSGHVHSQYLPVLSFKLLDLTDQCDGTKSLFELVPASLSGAPVFVFLNGVLGRDGGVDFTRADDSHVQLSRAPLVDDTLQVLYLSE
jgi:hypothetical protein